MPMELPLLSCRFPSLSAPSYVNRTTSHPCKFRLFATPVEGERNLLQRSYYEKLLVQDFLVTVSAVPSLPKLEALEKFRSISNFNHLLMSLVAADDFDLALKLKSNLSALGLVPDCWTYSILVDFHCRNNDPIEAKSVLHRMLEIGFEPDVATFTTLINAFCQSGRMRDAFEVFDVMSRIGCEPTINTYNCLLKGLCYIGRVEEAHDLLIEIKRSPITPDIYSYTALMDGLCKVGRSNEALELLDEALERKLTPNVVTYNTLFNGYFKEGRPLSGISLLKRMKERNCMPDCINYCTLLHGLLKWGKVRAALQVYREMVEVGFRVDERMMNTLLRCVCRQARKEGELLKDVKDVFEDMMKGNCNIYPCTYNLVVEALANGKETDKAFLILNDMVKAGFSPRTLTFNIVIRALCDLGEVNRALTVLMLVPKDRKPHVIPFSVLINELNRQGRSLVACNVFGLALKRGVVPKRKPVK